jgi:hypothetical protein
MLILNFFANCYDGMKLNLLIIRDVIFFIVPLAAKVKVSYTVQKRRLASWRRLASCIQQTKGTDRSIGCEK